MAKEKSATKLCKHCKTEIPAGAKVCPNCRKKQGGKLKFIVIILVVICIIGALAGGGDEDEPKKVEKTTSSNESKPQNKSSDKKESKKKEQTLFKVGETAEQNNIQITLVNSTESAGTEYLKPDDGNIFLICEFEIANNSDSDITISSVMCFEAYCDDYSINQDILGLQAPEVEGKNQLDGNVAAGKKMNGIIAYQVPANYSTLEVSVTPDFWSTKDIKFVVNK